ncbi:phage portal protein [Catellatospora methionotrophica]|uniref:phage portal protein n=1 Tax=Catellatospora methionotrophica TaxID=121620 RepID=UPI00140CEF98|nr:phage portal protein [Catellatospora methionotrophica]
MRWPRIRRWVRNALSISDPALAKWFSTGAENYSGVDISESSVLALSAVWRSVAVIAGTLASLPLRSLRTTADGETEPVGSIFDNPGGQYGPTPYEWKETAFAHLLLHGNCFEFHVRNDAGGLVSLELLHPLGVNIVEPTMDEYRSGKLPLGGKWFDVTLKDGKAARFDAEHITHIPALSMDGLRGLSPLQVARNSLGTAAAGDRAAAKMFSSGALVSGLVSPEEDMEPEEVGEIKRQLNQNVSGWDNAGAIAVVNRRLTFTPWTLSAVDAQFLQSRQFSIEEIARWWGVHPTLLMQTDKQTSWGTGIEEQNRGLGRTVLSPWAQRFEQRNSRLLAQPRFVAFDFAGLERPSPKDEVELLMKQTGGKPILSVNEARKRLNLPPVEGGDELIPPPPPPLPAPTEDEEEETDGPPAAE